MLASRVQAAIALALRDPTAGLGTVGGDARSLPRSLGRAFEQVAPAISLFRGSLLKIRHNVLWSVCPATLAALKHADLELRAFVEYDQACAGRLEGGVDARVRRFATFLRRFLATRGRPEIAADFEHEFRTWEARALPLSPHAGGRSLGAALRSGPATRCKGSAILARSREYLVLAATRNGAAPPALRYRLYFRSRKGQVCCVPIAPLLGLSMTVSNGRRTKAAAVAMLRRRTLVDHDAATINATIDRAVSAGVLREVRR